MTECLHAELAVAPNLHGRPAAAVRQRRERGECVLIAVLGVDGLAGAKGDRRAMDFHLLPLGAGEVHFDPILLAIVEGMMLERSQIEVGAEFAIDARQEIEIEFCRHAFGIVVGRTQDIRVFDQVDADHQHRAGPKNGAGMAQKFGRLIWLEIADGRAREEPHPRPHGDRRRNLEALREVGDHRMHGKVRKIAPQLRRVLLQKIAGNIDRHIGLHRRRGAEQDACFPARTRAEFDQGAVLRKQRRDRRRIAAQQLKLAARRIIFRQLRDALEQSGAGQIVKIFRRQPLRLRRQPGDYVGGE